MQHEKHHNRVVAGRSGGAVPRSQPTRKPAADGQRSLCKPCLSNQKLYMNRRLLMCSHVMLSNEHKRHSLDAPRTGPWKVLRRGPKTYTIDWKGKAYTVNVDRLKPPYVLADFAELQSIRMATNKSVVRKNAPQETATDCGYVGLQANVSTVGLFANKYIALNHDWNITGNYTVKMHKTLNHQCAHYTVIGSTLEKHDRNLKLLLDVASSCKITLI